MNLQSPKSVTLAYLIHEVAKLWRRRFEEEARSHGITLPQWRTLAEITKNEGISQVSLASCVDADPMTMSGILDRLEKRGLVERYADPADSRAKLARITPQGRTLVEDARNVGLAIYDQALRGVSTADQRLITASLERIRDNLNAPGAEVKEVN